MKTKTAGQIKAGDILADGSKVLGACAGVIAYEKNGKKQIADFSQFKQIKIKIK